MSYTVNENHLRFALEQVKGLRKACFEAKLDPWAVRQALLIAIEFDTEVAKRRGVTEQELKLFDGLAIGNAKQVAKGMP